MNKKAQVDDGYSETGNSIHAITLIIFGTIMAVSLTYSVSYAISDNITLDKDIDNFFTREAIRHCFLYENSGRFYYQTINPDLITNDRLEECVPNSNIAVRLLDSSGSIIKNATSGIGRISGDDLMVYKVNKAGSKEQFTLMVSIWKKDKYFFIGVL